MSCLRHKQEAVPSVRFLRDHQLVMVCSMCTRMTCTVRGPVCASCCCCAWLSVLIGCEDTLPLTLLTAVLWGDAGSMERLGGRAGHAGSDLGASSQRGTIVLLSHH